MTYELVGVAVRSAICALAAMVSIGAAPSPLQSPFATQARVALTSPAPDGGCPAAPSPPKGPLGSAPRYDPADPTHSRVLEDRRIAFDRSIAPLKSYLHLVVLQAQRSSRQDQEGRVAGRCTGALLARWARVGALDNGGDVNDDYVIATTLSGLALAYLQAAPDISRSDAGVIKVWFLKRSEELQSRMDGRRALPVYVNNHRLWVGLASAAVGVVADSQPNFDWGMTAFREEACAVTKTGAMPEEMKRGSAALRYQVYALNPLVTLSEFAEHNGRKGYDVCGASVRRAVAFALAPDARTRARALSGSEQEPVRDAQGAVSHSQFAWLYIYAQRFAVSPDWSDELKSGWWGMDELGGDVRRLYVRQPAQGNGS